MDSDAPQSIQGLPAGFVSRLIAFVIDLAIITVVASTVTLVGQFVGRSLGVGQAGLLIIALGTLGFTVVFQFVFVVGLTAIGGQTVGKRIMGLRVVRPDGSRVKAWPAIKRYFGYFLSLPLFWGYLMVLVDGRRQAFHDKLADTVVIYFMMAEGEPGPLEKYLAALAARRRARLAAQRAAQLSEQSQPANPSP